MVGMLGGDIRMKRRKTLAILMLSALVFMACKKDNTNTTNILKESLNDRNSKVTQGNKKDASDPINSINPLDNSSTSITDDLGYKHTITNPKRVSAVMGSLAEIWLLAGGSLVGVTEDAVSERNLVIAEDVTILGDVKQPNPEKLIDIDTELVLLSADLEGHQKIYDTLSAAGMTAVYFHIDSFEDYLRVLKISTDINRRPDLYEKNGLEIQEQIDAVIERSKMEEQKSVLFIRAFSSGAKAKGSDNLTGEILKNLGCDNIVERHDSLLEELSIEEIIMEDPDYIFVVVMGEDQEAALNVIAEGIAKNPAWGELTAVKNDRFIVLPKDLFHYKPNNRWGESYEYLANILFGEE